MDREAIRLLEADISGNYQQIEQVYGAILQRQPTFRDRIDGIVRIALQLRDPFRQDMERFLEQLS